MIKSFRIFLKVALSLVLLAFLYKHLFIDNSITALFSDFLQEYVPEQLFLLPVVLMLMVLNWGLESKKWHLLLNQITHVHMLDAVRQVVAGVSLAIFTPNRIGEYAGRIFLLPQKLRLRGVVITILGTVSHMIICLVFGLAGLMGWLWLNPVFSPRAILLIIGAAVLAVSILLLVYLRLNRTPKLFQRWGLQKRLRRIVLALQILRKYKGETLGETLVWSLLRYATYTLQYLLLLIFFGVDIAVMPGLAAVTAIFFAQFFIPAPAIVELGIRSSVAVFFISPFSDNLVGIIMAATALWGINLVIPAIFGAVLVINRLIKSEVV